MKRFRASVMFLGVLVGIAMPARGFWSASFFSIHQEITRTALTTTGVYSFGGQPYVFSERAILAINAMHKLQDDPDPDAYHPQDHFDSEHLVDGFSQLMDRRRSLENALSQPSPNPNTIWQWTGMLLHQIQDYYSHSTWIASGHIGTQNFGALTLSTPTASVPSWFTDLSYPITNPIDCEFDFFTLSPLVASDSLITTGYYESTDPFPGKCNHGLFGVDASGLPKTYQVGALCLAKIYTAPDGIAVDSPCLIGTAPAYKIAHDAALLDTQTFIQSITDTLSANGNGPGFCALLGVDPSNSICAPTNPVTNTNHMDVMTLSAVPSAIVSGSVTNLVAVVSAPDAAPPDSPTPAGTVVFTDSSNGNLCTVTLIAGIAACPATITTSAASDTVTATYSGDPTYLANSASTEVTILPGSGGITGADSTASTSVELSQYFLYTCTTTTGWLPSEWISYPTPVTNASVAAQPINLPSSVTASSSAATQLSSVGLSPTCSFVVTFSDTVNITATASVQLAQSSLLFEAKSELKANLSVSNQPNDQPGKGGGSAYLSANAYLDLPQPVNATMTVQASGLAPATGSSYYLSICNPGQCAYSVGGLSSSSTTATAAIPAGQWTVAFTTHAFYSGGQTSLTTPTLNLDQISDVTITVQF